MSRKDILKLFREFLLKNNSLEYFVEENKRNETYKVSNPNMFISGSFAWKDIPRLSELNKLWIKELKNKGIEC